VLVAFLAAVQFLTVMPPILRRMFTPEEMGRAVTFFPVVGLLLGGVLLGLQDVSSWVWPAGVTAGLVLVAWVLLTGALHLDGFLDTCDGLFGGRTPEDRLRIMRDERVGAFAVVGGVLLLLMKYVSLAASADPSGVLLVAPVLGRWSMSLAVVSVPYARREGLGRDMKVHAGWRHVILASLIAASVCWLAGAERGLAAMVLAAIVTWLAARFTLRRLPGLTGDIYGAICELVEVVVLLLFAARAPA
jgi:adenosylcobinamide-GDP ribazoletransferase